MTNMDPVMEPICTNMIPCPGVGILKMIPCSAARPRTEKYTSTSPGCKGCLCESSFLKKDAYRYHSLQSQKVNRINRHSNILFFYSNVSFQ